MDPIPDDFAPDLSVYQYSIIHQRTVNDIRLEFGYPRDQDSKERRALLLQEIWAATQSAEAGDIAAIAYAMRDRHAGHPVSSPLLSQANNTQG